MGLLGIKGLTSNVDPDTMDVAKAYIALSEAVMYLLRRPRLEAAWGSGWSTV